jgi:hypothetical protein
MAMIILHGNEIMAMEILHGKRITNLHQSYGKWPFEKSSFPFLLASIQNLMSLKLETGSNPL